MGELLDKQNKYFLHNEEMLLEKYEGQFIVIHDEQVADSFGSERDAYVYSVKHFQIGTFLIREVTSKRTLDS
ncbi:MAG: hypothetical protein ABJF04_06170 [Reichenbachiella sp.]|uniref:hypothetical protein n=1 Tax=Reichenbachiella sp. TaxID=2184521 RepID=UPI003265EF5C